MDRRKMRRLPLPIYTDDKGHIWVFCTAASDCVWSWFLSSADAGENGVSIMNAIEHVKARHPEVFK